MTKHLNHLITRGMTVEIMDPKHSESAHPATFMGEVCQCDQDHVLVKDTENHIYDVFLDEILCLMNYQSSTSRYCLRVSDQGYDVLCILPTGFIETLATELDHTTATHVVELLSKPVQLQKVAA